MHLPLMVANAAVLEYLNDAATALASRVGERRLAAASAAEIARCGDELTQLEQERRQAAISGRAEQIRVAQAWVRRSASMDDEDAAA